MELVKITYRFADGHVEEMEVEQEVAEALKELDRQEYNNIQKETRRHSSLSNVEYEDKRFAARNADVLEIILRQLDAEVLHQTLIILTSAQQDLVQRVFFRGERPSDIAKAQGVDKSAIAHRLERIYRQLKKLLL